MSYGPLEFAAWLQRKDERESAKVRAARAAVAAPRPPENRLAIASGGPHRQAGIPPGEQVTTASEAAAPDVR